MVFIIAILSIISICLRAVSIKILWDWFIFSQFVGMPHLSYVGAYGITLFVAAISRWDLISPNSLKENNDQKLRRVFLSSIAHCCVPPLMLFLGWIAHSLM